MATGSATTGTLFLPPNSTFDTYYKFGPTPDNATPHWYEFLYDGTTGAEFVGDQIILHFVDGARGDGDLTANGIVADPGAPGHKMNQPPVANAGGPYTISEGESLLLDASASSDPDTDPLAFAWELNGDGSFDDAIGQTTNLSWTQLVALGIDDDNAYDIAVRVDDGKNPAVDALTTLTIHNVAPTATLTNDGPVGEGGTATVSFLALFDPSTADIEAGLHYAYDLDNDAVFDVGDGTYAGSVLNASEVVPANLLADGPGTRTVTARILDKDGGATDYTTKITINNVPPAVAADLGVVTVDER